MIFNPNCKYSHALVEPHHEHLAVSSPTGMELSNGLCFGPSHRLGMDFTYMSDPDLYCYSLFYFTPYDPEDIWALVQRHQGNIAPQVGGHYDFYIHRDYACLLVLAFPLLKRQYQKDLYI